MKAIVYRVPMQTVWQIETKMKEGYWCICLTLKTRAYARKIKKEFEKNHPDREFRIRKGQIQKVDLRMES
jgi:hypothetical protein